MKERKRIDLKMKNHFSIRKHSLKSKTKRWPCKTTLKKIFRKTHIIHKKKKKRTVGPKLISKTMNHKMVMTLRGRIWTPKKNTCSRCFRRRNSCGKKQRLS
jgi:hypothetical protein